METAVWGVVKERLIVPNVSRPEGVQVEMRVFDTLGILPSELGVKFEGKSYSDPAAPDFPLIAALSTPAGPTTLSCRLCPARVAG